MAVCTSYFFFYSIGWRGTGDFFFFSGDDGGGLGGDGGVGEWRCGISRLLPLPPPMVPD